MKINVGVDNITLDNSMEFHYKAQSYNSRCSHKKQM